MERLQTRGPFEPGEEPGGALSDFPTALVEVTLERLVASSTFRRSQRHRQFLVHVVHAGLARRHDQLKEVIIGLEVFGRMLPAYDPRRDPIVRVEAGRIREKLARFYDGEGAAEPFQIVLPVGNYIPRFARRKLVVPSNRQPRSVVVLPFLNLAGEPDDAALSLGLADQLIDTLGKIAGWTVAARVSQKSRGDRMDTKVVGTLRGVNYVVAGSLQRSGGRLRCIAHLSRTRDNVRVWSQRFDYDRARGEDLLDFQDTIADAVHTAVSTLRLPPSNDVRPMRAAGALRPENGENRDARELLERARHLAQHHSPDNYQRAAALLERAVAIDPTFAEAHSHLAWTLARLVVSNHPDFGKAREAADRALELDPLDGEARALLATVAWRTDYAWGRAEPMFREALRLSPHSPRTHSAYAWGLVFDGRFDEAMQHARVACDLDPLDTGLRADYAAIAYHAGRYELAVGEFHFVLDREPDHVFGHVMLAATHLKVGRYDLASSHLDRICALAPIQPTARFLRICLRGLRHEAAHGREELDALIVKLGGTDYSRIELAMAQLYLGEREKAYASLASAADARDPQFVSLPVHPLFAGERNDPRFVALLRRIGPAADPCRAPVANVSGARKSTSIDSMPSPR